MKPQPHLTPLEIETSRALVRALETRRATRATDTASRLVGYVIRRLEFPKYGEPVKFSPTDRLDAQAAGFSALADCGFFETLEVTPALFKAIRNAIAGKDCLRLRCKWELQDDDFNSLASVADRLALASFHESPEIDRQLSKRKASCAKEIMRLMHAARKSDNSRKRQAAFQTHRNFFLLSLSIETGKGNPRNLSPGAFDTAKTRFLDYLAKGAIHLRETRQAPPSLGAEIMQALASRWL